MAFAVPQFSRSRVDRAGQILVSTTPDVVDLEAALTVINNWRSSHSFPLNTFQTTLRTKARTVDNAALVAQRIKRLSSIEHKLRRFSGLRLSQVQDIGGCRAVVATVADVHGLHQIYRNSRLKHRLVREDDYIRSPRTSGYRGIHLVYRYRSDRKKTYQDLLIEVQLRSQLQHAWATAVETVGTLVRSALKSSIGDREWLGFFSLMGSAIASRERSPQVPGTPSNRDVLRRELKAHIRRLDVEKRLRQYGEVLNAVEHPSVAKAQYFLLELRPLEGQLMVSGFNASALDRATTEYLRIERSLQRFPGAEAVLVSVESLAALRKAYPNYFLDTNRFITAMHEAVN